jgi:hypothetical protein
MLAPRVAAAWTCWHTGCIYPITDLDSMSERRQAQLVTPSRILCLAAYLLRTVEEIAGLVDHDRRSGHTDSADGLPTESQVPDLLQRLHRSRSWYPNSRSAALDKPVAGHGRCATSVCWSREDAKQYQRCLFIYK